MWQGFLFFGYSVSFAYSHPFVCFVYKSAVVEERQSSYLRQTSSDYGTARKILGGMPWNTSRLYCQGLFFVCRADNGWLLFVGRHHLRPIVYIYIIPYYQATCLCKMLQNRQLKWQYKGNTARKSKERSSPNHSTTIHLHSLTSY